MGDETCGWIDSDDEFSSQLVDSKNKMETA